MSSNETGAPLHKSGVIPAGEMAGAPPTPLGKPVADLGPERLTVFAALAEHLIPAAHGMPSAAEVVTGERLRFVLEARPDLLEPLAEALHPELSTDAATRLGVLERDEPVNLAALQLVIVAGYYTDERIRELIGYPGQLAIEVRPHERPAYVEEGLIEAVVARGPVWRDPATGRRAETDGHPINPDPWSEAAGAAEGGIDGRQGT